MSALIKYVVLGSLAVVVFLAVARPRKLRVLGRQARLLGLVYVVAVLTSAALDLAFGWGR